MAKRVLITGASGFVGANLARRLHGEGFKVTALLRPSSDCWRLQGILEQISVIRLNLENSAEVSQAVTSANPQWVFHLATHGGYSWESNWARMVDVNLHGGANLVSALEGSEVEALVCAGSSSEYGYCSTPPTENSALRPNSEYAVAKAASSMYFQMRAESVAFPIVILRLYSVYGPYEDPKRLIPTLITNGLNGLLPPLVAPEVARDFVFIDDVVEAFIQAARQASAGRFRSQGQESQSQAVPKCAVFNIGSGQQTKIRDAVSVAKRSFNIYQEPNWGSMDNRRWDTESWQAEVSNSNKLLDWRARIELERGFSLTAKWLSADQELLKFYRNRQSAPL